MEKRGIGKKIAMATVATLILGTGSVVAATYSGIIGPHADGTGTTPHNWTLTPVGQQVNLGDFPMNGVISPDHQYMVVTNDGQGTQSLQVVDLQSQKVVQTVSYNSPGALFLGVAFSPDGKTLYASAGGNNKIRVYSFTNGTLTEQAPLALTDANKTDFYPAGITVSPDGTSLYVANNLANSVSRVNLTTGQISTTTAVGKNPYQPLLSRDGKTLYVSNWGESSVTVLDANTLAVKQTIEVGLHPNAMTENPVTGMIYIANSDSDSVSMLDPTKMQVTRTIALAPYHDALTGSQPDALTVSPDGQTLYVANAGNNDIAVVDFKSDTPKVKGLIPTAWYPTGVFTSPDGKHLMVLNAKGLGAGPNTQGQYIGNMMNGTISFLDVPNEGQLQKDTKQVDANNTFHNGLFQSEPKDSPVPAFAAQKSPIKHVIYVIKENRTYDQVFGDMNKGNGDTDLTMFGQNITPNLHKLASQFTLLDNFYADAEISAQGHNWTTAAKANDYTEKNWLANYSGRNRSYDFEGGNSATRSAQGYLWDDAQNAGVSFRDYGEFVNKDPKTGLYVAADPGIGQNLDPNYPGFDLSYSDLDREAEWAKEYQQFEQNGNLPQLEIVRLPNDHTSGTKPGALTPQAMVAQNDFALGKLVDTVSHSKDWQDTAIFVTEDDAQNGLDHVDAHRTESLVISPYTQKGSLDSTVYDTTSMIRTMELILGLKPMTQFDASATPMLGSFTDTPNFKTYSVAQPTYPLDQKNGANAPSAQVSQAMDFSKEDAAPSDQLNRVLWEATKGNKPYPSMSNRK